MSGKHGSKQQMWPLKQKQSAHIWNWMQEAQSECKMARVFWNIDALPQWHMSWATPPKTLQTANWGSSMQMPGLWGTSHQNHHTPIIMKHGNLLWRTMHWTETGHRVKVLKQSSGPHRPSAHHIMVEIQKTKRRGKQQQTGDHSMASIQSVWPTPIVQY